MSTIMFFFFFKKQGNVLNIFIKFRAITLRIHFLLQIFHKIVMPWNLKKKKNAVKE